MAQFDALIRSTLDILGLCMWERVTDREQLHVEICCLAWESSARSFPFSQNTRAAAINWLRVSHYLSLTTPATVL
jgi:hypothetical protein